MAMAQKESTFRSKVTNPYGIKGMMQTSDSLAKKYGYKPSELYEAKVSIDVEDIPTTNMSITEKIKSKNNKAKATAKNTNQVKVG